MKVDAAWSLVAMAWLPDDEASHPWEELKAVMTAFPCATCEPFGGDRIGVLLRANAHEAPPDEVFEHIESLLGIAGDDVLRYADRTSGQWRAMRLGGPPDEIVLEAFLLAGDTSAQAWIGTVLEEALPAQAYGRMLLAPGATPPVVLKPSGTRVCTCFNVTQETIIAHLRTVDGSVDERVESVRLDLGAGNRCGTCETETKRLARAVTPVMVFPTRTSRPDDK